MSKPRPIASGILKIRELQIPVKLFTAASAQAVNFNLLHAKDLSRIQQKIYCPVDDAIIDRSELVRGFQVEKGKYVTFSDAELANSRGRADRDQRLRAHRDGRPGPFRRRLSGRL